MSWNGVVVRVSDTVGSGVDDVHELGPFDKVIVWLEVVRATEKEGDEFVGGGGSRKL